MERESASHHQCVCCAGVIDGLADDAAIEFDARVGLFTDECAFVCNDCTASSDRGHGADRNSAAEITRR